MKKVKLYIYFFGKNKKKYVDSKVKKLCMCRLYVRLKFYRKKVLLFYDREKNVFFNKKDIKYMIVIDGCYVIYCV